MLNYSRQSIDEEDKASVVDVLESSHLTQGPKVKEFETAIANYIGVPYVACVNSATSALHTLMVALEVGPGSSVWVPGISFVATANCAEYCGANVKFFDVDAQTGNVSIAKLEGLLSSAEAANTLPEVVIAVDIGGRPCDLDKLLALKIRYGFLLIHDASHSFGSEFNSRKVGSIRGVDATVFSFHAVKPITTGEGGAICSFSSALVEKCKSISTHCIDRSNQEEPWVYDQTGLGFNYRLTDIQAALGVTQVHKSERFIEAKAGIAKRYDESLYKFRDRIATPIEVERGSRSAHHLYQIRVLEGAAKRRAYYDLLRQMGILSNVHYRPIYRNTYFIKKYGENALESCELFYSQILALPMYPNLTNAEQNGVISALNKIFDEIV
jgi:dTDP-4-amino-4,6-dideoxygalactose transaminase